jgi:hypothetical protein
MNKNDMGRTGHVIPMREMRAAYKIVGAKPEGLSGS